jgi:hypothetical protein
MSEENQEERRKSSFDETGMSSLLTRIIEMSGEFAHIRASFSGLRNNLEAHMRVEEKQYHETNVRLQVMSNKLDEVLSLKHAFPQIEGKPDVHGHRVYHDGLIEENKKSTKLWEAVKTEIVVNAARALFIGLTVILLMGLKDWAVSLVRNALEPSNTNVVEVHPNKSAHTVSSITKALEKEHD